MSSVAITEHEDTALFESMLVTPVEEDDPTTIARHQLFRWRAVLFCRGIRLAKAEAFETKANRIGAAQDLVKRGFDTAVIMRTVGLKSVNVLARYLENVEQNV